MLKAFFAAALLGLLFIAGYVFSPMQNQNVPSPWLLVIKPGQTLSHEVSSPQWSERVKYPHLFAWMMQLLHLDGEVKPGEYILKADVSPYRLMKKLIQGDVARYALTVVEGSSWQRFRQSVESLPLYHRKTFSEQAILAIIQTPYPSAEGLFYPTTYQWHWLIRPEWLYGQSHRLMMRHLQEAWQGRADHLPYDRPYDLLIAASLIEREVRLDHERKLVAGVIINRLNKGMRLQIDASVLYGLGRERGKLSRHDLRKDTPYNTYVHKGLPPTPIALPSLASLQAAAHPSNQDLWYYVLCGNQGQHCFSKTWQAHRQAIIKQRKRNKNG